jgi:excisionase family DNA binding protein
MDDRLLTAHEVADQLRVSTMTIYRLIRRGELPAVRVGRNYRVRESELEAYLSAQVVDPATMDLSDLDDAHGG